MGIAEPDTKLLTADDLLAMGDRAGRVELVYGRLVEMPPTGWEHGVRASKADRLIGNHVDAHQLGATFGAETGFILESDPDLVRAPDAAFVTAERMAAPRDRRGFFRGPPDLAIEVLSPDDTAVGIEQKVDEYLSAGTRAVWVINPTRRTLTVHRPNERPLVLREADTLDGGDVLPGFAVRVGEFFA